MSLLDVLMTNYLSTSQSPTKPPLTASYSLDAGWRFALEGSAPLAPCPANAWTKSLDGMQTLGLKQVAAITEERCAAECCADPSCETYQFCNASSCGSGPPQQASCWVGRLTGATTQPSKGWIGRGRTAPPAPPPAPANETKCSEPWCRVDTDDSTWRAVSVPHDFVVEGSFSRDADMSHGYLPYGVGLYRKRFALPAAVAAAVAAGSHVASLEFDGAQTRSTVYLNGRLLGSHASGYTPFAFALPASRVAAARALEGGGAELLVAVRVDATAPDGWWYDGGGLYRHVRLAVVPAMHLARPGGVYLPSSVTGPIDAMAMAADARVAPVVVVSSVVGGRFSLLVVVRDGAGAEVGRTSGGGEAAAGAANVSVALPAIALKRAALWTLGRPTLYEVTTALTDETRGTVDTSVVHIGVRQAAWSAAAGFSLNGVPTKVLGAANHQDFAGVGVAVPDSLQAHRVAKLQQMGCNAWRTAHNAPTPALLDAADRLGMLVWDENHRNGQDDELRRLVLRDRNHPSIILWSICNEKLCDTSDTLADARRLHAAFHALDPDGGRLVSANYNGWLGPDTPLDVQGIDYATQTYDDVHKQAPDLPAISSETSSAVSDRGEYANNQTAGHVRGYDTEHPSWGQTAEGAWGGVDEPAAQGILTRPFIAGGFTWTGWDYKGEPTPYAWPNVNSHFGILDIAGFAKDRFHWYKAHFPSYAPGAGTVHLLPHWNWAAGGAGAAPHLAPCAGRCAIDAAGGATVEVWAFSNGALVELYVNGKSHGVAAPAAGSLSHFAWPKVPYAAGEIRAVAYDAANRTLASQTVATTGAPAALRVAIKDGVGNATAGGRGGAGGLVAGCDDVALVQVEIVDEQGRVVPTAADVVTLSSAGAPLTYLGGGNGDPSELTRDKSPARPAFHGLLLGIFASTNATGTATVTARAPGLAPASLAVRVLAPAFASAWWCDRAPGL